MVGLDRLTFDGLYYEYNGLCMQRFEDFSHGPLGIKLWQVLSLAEDQVLNS